MKLTKTCPLVILMKALNVASKFFSNPMTLPFSTMTLLLKRFKATFRLILYFMWWY